MNEPREAVGDPRELEPPFHLRYVETPTFRFGEYGFGMTAITLTRAEAEFMVARSPGKYTIEPAEHWGEKMSRKNFEFYTQDKSDGQKALDH